MKISVLMPTCDRKSPQYLEPALQSLADQTLKADEVVLVEDGEISRQLCLG
ncbi:MAG: glycosyltransferase [Desulfosalsimonas sp.]